MSGSEKQVIQVRANAKRNGLTTLLIGFGVILVSALWLAYGPNALNLPGFFLCSAGIVTVLIGWFKLREPDYSIEITPQHITYHHRLGLWQVAWDDIVRFDQPTVTHGIEYKKLDVVGVKISNYEGFLKSISPRLATHLLMEQRPLLFQAPDRACTSGSCAGDDILHHTKFTLPSGKVLTGVQAMLANRMKQLRDTLGYDIFISASELDREPAAFIGLLRECHQSRMSPS
ncbi:DUF2982 domain-containing protein [Alteromonas sp. 5E99-2]|uniref:DUF2982 domain-containing protein n=1 Tax=Alteromonas sp. 5E99-2 TaxID=2817683 RepID=UPI001A98B7E1|nr:DUF2982 domain-containing protein [Alteromonas sp. 5E99-2]MBO1254653.1 DUF2982 domain-containing protein [Alteromonas sp. 5E99-2]